MDPADAREKAWCAQRRAEVADYMRRQGVTHGEIGEVPAWFVFPYVSIWAVESGKVAGSVGWWAICGDLPTDYCSSRGCRHPRLAARRIADDWLAQIASMQPGDATIGETGLEVSLVPLLRARATLLLEFSDNDANWPD